MSLPSNQEMDDFIIDLVSIRQIPIIIYADSSIYNGIICNETLSVDLTAEDLKSAITNCRNRYINQQKIIDLLINQRKSKQKISLLEKRWDDFIYKNTAPIYQHDVNGKLLKPNDAMWKMFDYDPNDPNKPQNIDDFIIHDQYDYKLDRIKRIISDGELNQPGSYNLRKKDGSIITVETRSIVLENDKPLRRRWMRRGPQPAHSDWHIYADCATGEGAEDACRYCMLCHMWSCIYAT